MTVIKSTYPVVTISNISDATIGPDETASPNTEITFSADQS